MGVSEEIAFADMNRAYRHRFISNDNGSLLTFGTREREVVCGFEAVGFVRLKDQW